MGQIYRNASITIVAAVFANGEAGLLPSTGSQDWLDRWDSSDDDDLDDERENKELKEVLTIIGDSVWNTRAWTFQESYLSTRTLVVHQRGMFFECGQGFDQATATEISEPAVATDPFFTRACLSNGPVVRQFLDFSIRPSALVVHIPGREIFSSQLDIPRGCNQ